MGKKLSGVYEVLIQGLCRELSGHDLYKFVTERCKASSDKRICKASLLAMSDTRVADANALEAIYSLAAYHRVHRPG